MRSAAFIIMGICTGLSCVPLALVASLANGRIPAWMKTAQWSLAAFFGVCCWSGIRAGLAESHNRTDEELMALAVISILLLIALVPACVEYIRIFRTRPPEG